MTFIYALCDPHTGDIRYVGKSNDPKDRLRRHLRDRRKNHRTDWIMSILKKGTIPNLVILDHVSDVEWPQWEVAYVQYFKDMGFDLVNANEGGIGGHNPSPELRKKLSEALSGKSKTISHREKLSLAHRGRKLSDSWKSSISISLTGVKKSQEHRRKIGESQLGRKRSPESCLRMKLAQQRIAEMRRIA